MGGGYAFQSFQPMLSPAIAYRGQPIALVAAESIEAAIEAAALVEATYEQEAFSVTLDSAGTEIVNQADTPLSHFIPEINAGDADKAYRCGARSRSTPFSTVRHSTRIRSS